MRQGSPSILPNSSAEVVKPLVGKHGTFVTRWLGDDLDMHGLFILDLHGRFFAHEGPEGGRLLAGHHNGHSCRNLAERIVAAWDDPSKGDLAMDQFRYILACGGIGIGEKTIQYVIAGGEK